ncbi:MAG: hypothetical protein PHI11_14415 [Gallionella sp.]|nr:hypothetical protein [Gallionella sp.]
MNVSTWLKNSRNQNLLKFIGGGVVAIPTVWVAYSALLKEPPKPAPPPVVAVSAIQPVATIVPSQSSNPPVGNISVTADHHSIATLDTGHSNVIHIGK